MKLKKFIILSLYLLAGFSLWSFDLSLADIYTYSPEGADITVKDVSSNIFKSLRKTDKEGILNLSKLKSNNIPKSILDAAIMSETEKCDFLLYGFLKISKNYFDFELKLYDREAGEIKKVFYTKTDRSNYKNLIQTMSDRINGYFYSNLGITKRRVEEEKERGVIDLKSGIGYWIPFDPWAESLIGIAVFHISSSLTPVDSLFEWDIFTFTLGYGIGLDYSLGMNREGFEGYIFHSIDIGFPVSFSALWYYQNKIIFQIAPELQVDILTQDRLYGSLVTEKSAAFSLSTSIGYEYLFTRQRLSLGFLTRFHTVFYNNILFSIEPSLYCRYRFNPLNKGLVGSKLFARPCNQGNLK